MQKLILEVSDRNKESLVEPVFLQNLRELPVGMMQAVEDFIDAHDGKIAPPVTVTARTDEEPEVSSLISRQFQTSGADFPEAQLSGRCKTN